MVEFVYPKLYFFNEFHFPYKDLFPFTTTISQPITNIPSIIAMLVDPSLYPLGPFHSPTLVPMPLHGLDPSTYPTHSPFPRTTSLDFSYPNISQDISSTLPSTSYDLILPSYSPTQTIAPIPHPNPPNKFLLKTHPMVTHTKIGKLKPKVFLSNIKPHTEEALVQHYWFDAMQTKYNALQHNVTWSLVPLFPHNCVICCKWVFKVNEDLDGSINKYKACLVAKGFV